MEVLIAEDEINIANSLKKNLLEEGHHATIAQDGQRAIELLDRIEFDLILLDWRMPKITGIEVLKKIKEKKLNVMVILLTALSDITNKVEALELGADDYITKPFSFEEVMARIYAVQRRYNKSNNILEFSGLFLDLMERSVKFNGDSEKLTEKEFEVLKHFIENKGVILKKEDLCKSVWGYDFNPSTNLVEVTIKNLRKKLEDLTQKKYIKTIYGEGFIIIDE